MRDSQRWEGKGELSLLLERNRGTLQFFCKVRMVVVEVSTLYYGGFTVWRSQWVRGSQLRVLGSMTNFASFVEFNNCIVVRNPNKGAWNLNSLFELWEFNNNCIAIGISRQGDMEFWISFLNGENSRSWPCEMSLLAFRIFRVPAFEMLNNT